jgi:hypothetical protein
MSRTSNFISEYRGAVIEFCNAIDHLRNLEQRYVALGMNGLTDADFTGDNEWVSAAEFEAAHQVALAATGNSRLGDLYKMII